MGSLRSRFGACSIVGYKVGLRFRTGLGRFRTGIS